MKLKDLKKKEESKPVTVYHYTRQGEVFTTPNAEIAIARRSGEQDIQVETVKDGESSWSTLVIQ
jgi:hypothetical protein